MRPSTVGREGKGTFVLDGDLSATLTTGGGAQIQGMVSVLGGAYNTFEGAVVLGQTAHLNVDLAEVHFKGPLTADSGAHIQYDGELFAQGPVLLQDGVTFSGGGSKYFGAGLALGDGFAQFDDTGAVWLLRTRT